MKKLIFTLIFSCCFLIVTHAQVVINEIMYNSPDGGADSIEYIELYNPGTSTVDIGGWSFTQGVTHMFENGTAIPAGGYLVVTVDATAMMDAFGITATEWESGGLSNGGEDIELVDAAMNVIDYVDYGSADPWPIEATGDGAAIELCGAMEDNSDASNWFAGTNATGVIIEGVEILGTPAAANTAMCAGPDATVIVSSNVFTPATVTINEGETVMWTNAGGFHNVNGDQSVYPDNPESFGNGAASNTAWTYEYTFNIPGTYQYQCDPHAGLGMVGTVVVLPLNTYPARSIADVSAVNADGVADSLGVACSLTGIVYGININGSGLAFTIIDENDANAGIAVYSQSENFGYTVMEGDKVTVEGIIGQFNGLQQIVAEDVELVDSGNALFAPEVITALGEAEESKLIRLNDVMITDYDPGNSGDNYTVTDGTTEFTVRIDNEHELHGMEITGTISVIGLGGQFDNSEPYTEGYQLLPRFASDIIGGDDPVEPTYPAYSIVDVTTVDAAGVVDSLGVLCELTGIVYGVNMRSSGLSFTIIDANDANAGIAVFSNPDDYGYVVTEGDEVTVRGEVEQFNGLQQIIVDTVILVSSGNMLFDPAVSTTLGEVEESKLVRFNDLSVVSIDGANVTVTDGTNEYVMRIDSDTNVDIDNLPDNFDAIGIGGQFDDSSPYDEGYQFFPRYMEDIMDVTSTIDETLANDIDVMPNPAANELFVQSELAIDQILITNNLGQRVAVFTGIPANGIDVSGYAQGVYQMTFVVADRMWTTLFVKQ